MLPYNLDTTNDLLTSRTGLLAVGELLETLKLSERVDQHFPLPKSNRGYPPSLYVKTLLLMQHEGGFHLDDVRHLQDDDALREVLDLKALSSATTLGELVETFRRRSPDRRGLVCSESMRLTECFASLPASHFGY